MVCTKKRKRLSNYKGGAKSEVNYRNENNKIAVKETITHIKKVLMNIVRELQNDKHKPVGVEATIIKHINGEYLPAIELDNEDEMKDLLRKLTRAHKYLLNTSINIGTENVKISPKIKNEMDKAQELIKSFIVSSTLRNNPNTELADLLNENSNRMFKEVDNAKAAAIQINKNAEMELNRRERNTRAELNTSARRRHSSKKKMFKKSANKQNPLYEHKNNSPSPVRSRSRSSSRSRSRSRNRTGTAASRTETVTGRTRRSLWNTIKFPWTRRGGYN